MSPDMAGVLSGIVVAAIAAGPAYLTARRARTAACDEGAHTRDAIGARLDALTDEMRSGTRELRADVADVRAWTAGHTAEHLLLSRSAPPSE